MPPSRPNGAASDPLLQFEPEHRHVRLVPGTGAETTAVKPGQSAVPVQRVPSAPVRRVTPAPSTTCRPAIPVRPRIVSATSAAHGRNRGSLWLFAVGAACGSALAVLLVLQMNAPSQEPSVPPSPVVRIVPTADLPPSPDLLVDGPPNVTPKTVPNAAAKIPRSSDLPMASPKAEDAAPAQFYGSLAIETAPVSARAFVNGTPVGVTPIVLKNIPIGSRAVRLEAADHVPWSSTVRIVADQQTHVVVTLARTR